jgi:hypothetical protein
MAEQEKKNEPSQEELRQHLQACLSFFSFFSIQGPQLIANHLWKCPHRQIPMCVLPII